MVVYCGVIIILSRTFYRECIYIYYFTHQCLHAFNMIARHVAMCSPIQNVLIANASLTSLCVIGKNCGLSSSVIPIGIPTVLDHKTNHFLFIKNPHLYRLHYRFYRRNLCPSSLCLSSFHCLHVCMGFFGPLLIVSFFCDLSTIFVLTYDYVYGINSV